MNEWPQRIAHRLSMQGVTVGVSQLDRLVHYLELLYRWNRHINLTALDEPDQAIDRLLLEPVLAASAIDADARTLVDVGSGGGSPAIPLKIMRPDLALTMVEVKAKKGVFLRDTARQLGLDRVSVETDRFERVLTRADMAGRIDALSCRAVRVTSAQLHVFAAALKPGGQQLWFLSGAQEPAPIEPLLALDREMPLVSGLGSRLLVVRKGHGVPRGT